MNQVYLQGWAEADPDVHYFGYDHVRATFQLRTEEPMPTGDDPERIIKQWHRITAWGASAQHIEELVREGYELRLRGRIAYHRETDRDGTTRIVTEIQCQGLEILDRPSHQSATPLAEAAPEIDWTTFAPIDTEDPMA